MTMRKFLSILLVLFCLQSEAYFSFDRSIIKTVKHGTYEYYFDKFDKVYISDIDSVALPVSNDSTLIIPSACEIDNKTYEVSGIVPYAFRYRKEIKHLILSEGIEVVKYGCFNKCPNLVSVKFPSTLNSIENEYRGGIFSYCDKLSRITINKNNNIYDARNDCNALIISESNKLIFGCKSTIIPSSVETIGKMAFTATSALESIIIPEGVKHIERGAFSRCNNLKKIKLPNSLETLEGGVFGGCTSLKSVFIPRNVSKIDGDLFAYCHFLKEVKVDRRNKTFDSRKNCNAIIYTAKDSLVAGCGASIIPEGIKSIGYRAFDGSSIKNIHIPRSVHHIAQEAFSCTTYCNSISVDSRNPIYSSPDNCNAIIETAKNKLIQGCCLTYIPQGIKEIGSYAFFGIILHPSFEIPREVEKIGKYAFDAHSTSHIGATWEIRYLLEGCNRRD